MNERGKWRSFNKLQVRNAIAMMSKIIIRGSYLVGKWLWLYCHIHWKLHCKVIMHVKKSSYNDAMSTGNRIELTTRRGRQTHHLESHLKLGYPGPTVRLGNYSSVNSLRSLKISWVFLPHFTWHSSSRLFNCLCLLCRQSTFISSCAVYNSVTSVSSIFAG